MRDSYAQIAEFYDLEHDRFTDDVEFYLQYVASIGDPVLELACGSGRITVPIAEAGFRVTGADISPVMLDRARQRASESSVDIELVEGNLNNATLISGGPFGVVIMALGALSHLATQEAQLEALTAARRALDPRGALLIDVMHASHQRLSELDGSYTLDGSWATEDGETVQRFSSHDVLPAGQQIETRIWYDHVRQNGQVQRHSMQVTQRYCSPGELQLMLEAAGFEDSMFYGGYELEPLENSSERIVVVAEATRT